MANKNSIILISYQYIVTWKCECSSTSQQDQSNRVPLNSNHDSFLEWRHESASDWITSLLQLSSILLSWPLGILHSSVFLTTTLWDRLSQQNACPQKPGEHHGRMRIWTQVVSDSISPNITLHCLRCSASRSGGGIIASWAENFVSPAAWKLFHGSCSELNLAPSSYKRSAVWYSPCPAP